jgi:outer membrane protein assembly factor BamB
MLSQVKTILMNVPRAMTAVFFAHQHDRSANIRKRRPCFQRQMLTMAALLCVGASVTLAEIPSPGAPETWPQWRGPQRNGAVDSSAWPNTLDKSHLQSIWRQEIGHGYSGPIVSPDKVFTVETRNKKKEVVRAFDRKTGKQLWERSWDGAMKVPFFASRNGSWVRSTPAYDGEYLYVAGMRDVLVCLRATDGSIKWQVDFVKRFGTALPDFGFVCSPLVSDDAVYVQAGAALVKLDKENCATLWRSLQDSGGMYGSAFSSPVMAAPHGIHQLVVQTRNVLAGVDPQNGAVLWQQPVKAFRGMNILTPVVLDNTVFTSSYGGGSFLYDLNHSQGKLTVSEAWKDKKSQAYMSTPVVIDGHIYVHRRDKRFSCVDPKTKKILWTSKPRFGQYLSLVANGSKILALDQKGELLLIDANPEAFTLVDRRKIATDSWAHLAVAGDQVFVRELQAISVYQWRDPVLAMESTLAR